MKYLIIAIGIIAVISCQNKTPKNIEIVRSELPANEKKVIDSLRNDSNGVFVWIDSVQNLQPLKDGQVISTSFRFKNGGNTLLLIKSAQGTCGCTSVQYPPKPLKPGEEGRIEITFDSKGKGTDAPNPSPMNKTITVEANTAQRTYTAEFNVIVTK